MPHRCCQICGEELSLANINAHTHTAEEVERFLLSLKGVALPEMPENPRP